MMNARVSVRWWVAAFIGVCLAGSPRAARAAEDVSLSVVPIKDGYRIHGDFLTSAPRTVIWSVLTDYDNLERFVSSMRSSHVKRHTRDSLVVEQVAVSRVLFITRTIRLVLDVREEPMAVIRFTDTSHRDVRTYGGEWELHEAPGGIRVDYNVRMSGVPGGPSYLVQRGVRGISRKLLREIRDEIGKRALAVAAP